MLLNLLYLCVLILAAPFIVWRMVTQGKYRDGWGQKLLGLLPVPSDDRPRVWFHAVSVGEVLQLRTVVSEFLRTRPGYEVFITTTTVTGMDVARREFPGATLAWFPLDFTWAVRRAIARVRPAAVVLVELEVWPNFIRAVHDAKIPIVLANGRISEKSFRGYSRLRPFVQPTFQRIALAGVQNETYRDRLLHLGMDSHRVTVTGSIKFDGALTNRLNPKTCELRAFFGIGDDQPVFIAGSTQDPEERIALETWKTLRTDFPGLRLVLVPRHRERFESVAQLVESHNIPLMRRSRPHDAPRHRRHRAAA